MATNKITIEAILNSVGIKRGVDEAETHLTKLSSLINQMLPTLSGAAIGAFIGASYREYAQAERGIEKLGMAVRNAGGDWNALKGQITSTTERMQFAAGVSDDELNAALRRMITMTGDVQGSLANLGLAADVAAAFDKDLVAAATAVSAAMEGNYRKLIQYIPELANMAKEGASAAEMMRLLADRTAGASGGDPNSAASALTTLRLSIDELKKSIGSLADSVGFTKFVNFISMGVRGVSMLASGNFAGAMGFEGPATVAPPGYYNRYDWGGGFGRGNFGQNIPGNPFGAPPGGFTGPPSPWGASYNGFWNDMPYMHAGSPGMVGGRRTGGIGEPDWGSLVSGPDSGNAAWDTSGERYGNALEQYRQNMQTITTNALTMGFDGFVNGGMKGFAKAFGESLGRAIEQAFIQKAGARIADKLFGAAKTFGGPIGWLFG